MFRQPLFPQGLFSPIPSSSSSSVSRVVPAKRAGNFRPSERATSELVVVVSRVFGVDGSMRDLSVSLVCSVFLPAVTVVALSLLDKSGLFAFLLSPSGRSWCRFLLFLLPCGRRTTKIPPLLVLLRLLSFLLSRPTTSLLVLLADPATSFQEMPSCFPFSLFFPLLLFLPVDKTWPCVPKGGGGERSLVAATDEASSFFSEEK